MYALYVHVAPNDKKYFGITSASAKSRWKNGYGYKSQSLFWKAIQKYGWDNFQHIILAENLTREWACELEQAMIARYDTTNPNNGYNISLGGDGPTGTVCSAKTREKLRQANLGHHHTKETIEKIKKNHAHYNKGRRFHFTEEKKERLYASRRGLTPWNKGKKLSEEYRKKLSESHMGHTPWNKGVPCSEETKHKVSLANKGKQSRLGKPLSDESKALISASLKNSVWVNNGSHRTLINETELDTYISMGYVKGKKYHGNP